LDGELDRPLLIDADHRSPSPSTCPFLRAVGDDDRLGPPVEAVDPRNRCIATGRSDPQDAAQQRMACLTASHVACRRYLSGVAGPTTAPPVDEDGVATEPDERVAAAAFPARGRGARTLTPAVVAATVFLVASASAAIAFVALRGGIDLPIASPRATEVALASPTPAATAEPTSVPTPTAAASPSPSPAPTATPAPTPTPTSTSDRYALLEPCPSTPDCYVYEIRAGDNLRSIANYFGVPYETVLEMNPQIGDPATIQPGDEIHLPPPTR
jgi:LysM repeat protein